MQQQMLQQRLATAGNQRQHMAQRGGEARETANKDQTRHTAATCRP